MGGHRNGRWRQTYRATPALALVGALAIAVASCDQLPQRFDPPRVIGPPLAEASGLIGDENQFFWEVVISAGEGDRWCIQGQLVPAPGPPRHPTQQEGDICNQLMGSDQGTRGEAALPQGSAATDAHRLTWGAVKRGVDVCVKTEDGDVPAQTLRGPWPFRVWVAATGTPAQFVIEDCSPEF